ncbi:hypothetical protein K1719_027542 [Acacia pycnantha]|nr:hypothetical protein K1719_027542 [Acacia pycnantha]
MRSFPSQISFLLLLLLFATTFNRSICTTIVGKEVLCNENDQNILLIFKQGVMNSSNRLSSWTSQEDCCLWEGVHCDNITGRVTELDLADYDLEGVINLSLLQLESLNHLDLSNNGFTTNFSAPLHYLDFSWNDMVLNDLRWLSQLSSVKYLNLSFNDIGSEPNWLQHVAMLPSLSELSLAFLGLRDFPSYNYVNFTSLKALDLYGNNISSKLPDSFFNVTKDISYINLDHNNFNGGLPRTLFKLPNLNYLLLSNNKFEGSIPSLVGNLSSLKSLYLSHNYFSGNLPESLGQLHKLSDLYIQYNSWVPPFQLKYFASENTSLGANFPAWLYTQGSLEGLWLSRSMISNIDADIFWSFIERIDRWVDLSNNFISGDISNVTLNSQTIVLEYNNFSGGLPHISTNVSHFWASHNSFSGSIFPFLCLPQSNGKTMSILELSYNHLSGILPDCWANWKQLGYLNLRSNKLTGKVPPSMASLNLDLLDLSDNNLFGKFSLDLLNWTNLQYLFLEGNEFSGSLTNLVAQNLVVIKLRNNQFVGNIPSQLCNLSSLIILDLAKNKLSGSIPHCLYNLTSQEHVGSQDTDMIKVFTKGRELDYKFSRVRYPKSGVIDLSTKILSGEIPKELFGASQMQTLNLSRNQLTGKIPTEIGDVTSLESLDLSYNRLSGEIPSTISNLSLLSYLNISYNNFIGQIPLGTQIQTFDSWSFVGNHELCGDPLPRKCNKKEETHDDSKLAEGKEDDNFLKSLYLGMGVGFALGFWGLNINKKNSLKYVLSTGFK